MLYFVLITAGMILLLLGWCLSLYFRGNRRSKNPESKARTPVHACPVCSTRLDKKEKVYSVVFSEIGADKIVHLRGCQYCIEGEQTRKCPVCKRILGTEEFIAARMSEKSGRVHVHILGCSQCCRFFV
ncbi:hypothetical protein FACS1894164_05250 [Spirochaetia bacterium]|nr:hypothetical protein FACS1894164_05250 [Spirochaetia bacterium]